MHLRVSVQFQLILTSWFPFYQLKKYPSYIEVKKTDWRSFFPQHTKQLKNHKYEQTDQLAD